MSVPLDSVHTMRVSIFHQLWSYHIRRRANHLVVSDTHRPSRSSFPTVYDLAGLPTRRISSTHPGNGWLDLRHNQFTPTRSGSHCQFPQTAVCTYVDELTCTEPSASVEPIIVPKFIDLHPLLLVRPWHHRCHSQIIRPSPSEQPGETAREMNTCGFCS